MKHLALLSMLLFAAGCGGGGSVNTPGNGAGSGSSSGSTSGGTTAGGSTSGTTGWSGSCAPNGTVVGAASANECCTGYANNLGACAPQPASSGSGGTSSSSSSGATVVTTTTSGTCPQNMPNIVSGTTTVVDGGACSELGCPQGFSCVNNECILHGASGGVQVALSWDVSNYEDLDLHVIEPNGTSAVWWGDPNRPAGTSLSGAVGSLDRDSNAGCPGADDGINIENVIYPSTGYPSGTYKVYMDYWKNCDGKSSTNYAIQVRDNGHLYVYCGTAQQSQADQCDQPACGTEVTTFSVP